MLLLSIYSYQRNNMDAEEVKDRLKSVINNLIKDQPDEAKKELHDVLAAKMRDRISPPEPEGTPDVGGEGDTDGDTGGEDAAT